MKRCRKGISLFLVCCMLMSMLPVTVLAASAVASGTCGPSLRWELSETGKLTISGNGRMDDYGDGVVPWNDYISSITELEIGDEVTYLGDRAFYRCTALKDVYIGKNVESIGSHTFYQCTELGSVTIPDSVEIVKERAFSGCSKMTSLDLGEGVKVLENYAFSGCNGLIELTIPGSVSEVIGFGSCINLEKVNIENGVSVIGTSAFGSCEKLNDVTIPKSVAEIKNQAFSGCDALTGITIPGSVTTIGGYAFSNSGLIEIIVPDSVELIGQYAFTQCSDLSRAVIGNGITTIDNGVFSSCASLKIVVLPESVTTVKSYAFNGSNSLKDGDVYYSGTEAQWNELEVNIQDCNDPFINATIHYNSTGPIIAVTGICLDLEEMTVQAGDTETLTATVYPENATNKGVTWDSDNAAVATVSDGLVTAVAEGEAVITATTVDGAYSVSCDVTVCPITFDIVVDVSHREGGFAHGGGTYNKGQGVTLNAYTNIGYVFKGWQENGVIVSADATYSFVAESDRNITAVFEPQAVETIDVTVNAEPSEWGTVSGGGTYPKGTYICVSAFSKPGYTFKGWRENGVMITDNSTNYYYFTADVDRTLTAVFEKCVSIVVNASPEGYGTFMGDSAYYVKGDTVTLTAYPNPGVTFKGWQEKESIVSDSNPYCFTADKDRFLYAIFEKQDVAEQHIHPLCGVNCGHTEDTHGIVAFDQVLTESTTSVTGGNYYLNGNVTFEDTLEISGTVNICLNGYMLRGTDQESVILIESGSVLNICDCDNSNGAHSYSITEAGRYVFDGTGENTVYGGVITGGDQTGTYSAVINNGSLVLYGGCVVGNSNAVGNNGDMELNGAMTVGGYHGIVNTGTLTMIDGTVTATSTGIHALYNDGIVAMRGGIVSVNTEDSVGMLNNGTAVISGGSVQSTGAHGKGIHSESNSETTIEEDACIFGVSDGIDNREGVLKITGGTVSSDYLGIYNQGHLTVEDDADITATAQGIFNLDTLVVSGGTVSSNTGIVSSGIMTIGGNACITGTSTGVVVAGNATTIQGDVKISGGEQGISVTAPTSVLTVSGGSITAENSSGYGIYNSGTLVIEGDTRIFGGNSGIANDGIAELKNGCITGGINAISNWPNGVLELSGGSVTSDQYAIFQSGVLKLSGNPIIEGKTGEFYLIDGKYITLLEPVNQNKQFRVALTEGMVVAIGFVGDESAFAYVSSHEDAEKFIPIHHECCKSCVLDEYNRIILSFSHTPIERTSCIQYVTCSVCNEVLSDPTDHTPGMAADCTNSQTCTVCGEILAEATGHDFTGEWKFDQTNHWKMCVCGQTEQLAAHSGGTATTTALAVCEICQQPYGEFVTMFNVTVAASPAEGGSVSGTGSYINGQTISVSATINEGYIFRGWQENGRIVFTAPDYTFRVSKDRTLTAVFEKIPSYTLKYDANGGYGAVPSGSTVLKGTEFTVAERGMMSMPGYKFVGWNTKANATGIAYQPGEKLTLNSDITLYAQWRMVNCSVSGEIQAHKAEYAAITVRLDSLDGVIYVGTVGPGVPKNQGNNNNILYPYTINAPKGTYNLYVIAVTTEGVTVTRGEKLLTLTDEPITIDFNLPYGQSKPKKSEVKKEKDAPQVLAGGLDVIVDEVALDPDTVEVEVALVVKAVEETSQEAAKIHEEVVAQSSSSMEQKLEFIELTVEKAVTDKSGEKKTENMSDLTELIQIVIPFESNGRNNIQIYRYHEDTVDTLTTVANKDGEKIEVFDTYIILYSKKFSTYAIGYTDETQTPDEPETPNEPDTPEEPNPPQQPTQPDNSGSSGGSHSGSPGSYGASVTVSDSGSGGKVTLDRKTAVRGSTVTITVSPDAGFELDILTVKDSSGKVLALTEQGGGKFTFTMPAGKVTVQAVFRPVSQEVWKNPFGDVPADSWYHDAVAFAMEQGIMSGYSADTFAPEDTLSRAMLAQILYNLEGKPAVSGDSSFADVSNNSWYRDAVLWTAQQGIVSGYGNGIFGSNDSITREQLAVMLYKYAGTPAHQGDLSRFSDQAEISNYALSALGWAVENNILSGMGDNRIVPKAPASRAQVAQIFKNFLET